MSEWLLIALIYCGVGFAVGLRSWDQEAADETVSQEFKQSPQLLIVGRKFLLSSGRWLWVAANVVAWPLHLLGVLSQ